MLKRFCKFIFKNPKITTAITIVLFVFLGTAIFFNYQTNMSPKVWFERNYDKLKTFEQFESDFGNDDSIILAIHRQKGLLNPDSIKLIQKLTDHFWQLDDVMRVDSLTNHQWSRSTNDEILIEPLFPDESLSKTDFENRFSVSLSDPTIQGYLLNKSGDTTLLFGRLKPSFDGKLKHTKVYNDVLTMTTNGSLPKDYQFYVSGIAATHGALDKLVYQDFFVVTPILIIIIAIIIFWLFHSLFSSVIILLVVLASIVSTVGFACWLGIPIDPMTSSMPQILVAIGVADTMHVLSSFYLYLRRSSNSRTALYRSLLKNILPTFMTTLTTVVAFLSLTTSDIVPIKHLGLLVAVGGFLAWIFSLTITSAIILFFPKSFNKAPKSKLMLTKEQAQLSSKWIFQHRHKIILTFLLITSSCFYLSTKNRVDSDPARYFRDSHFITKSNNFISESIGSTKVLEIVVDSNEIDGAKSPAFLKKVETFAHWLSEHPNVTKVVSALDIIKDVNKSMNADNEDFRVIPKTQSKVAESLFLYGLSLPQGVDLNYWMTIDNRKLRLSTWWEVNTTKESMQVLNDFQKKADELGLSIEKTGKGGLTANLGTLTVSTFFRSIATTLLIVSVFMAFLFKSIRLGLFSMLPNVVPLAIGGGVMFLIDFPLDIGTAIVTAISLGIAVDDTIHILEEFQKYRRIGYSAEAAVSKCLQHSGRAVFLTTILLTVGFMSFTVGQFVPTVEFGIMNSITIGLALITDIFLLPALLMMVSSKKSE